MKMSLGRRHFKVCNRVCTHDGLHDSRVCSVPGFSRCFTNQQGLFITGWNGMKCESLSFSCNQIALKNGLSGRIIIRS
jgi:hypothetical protein